MKKKLLSFLSLTAIAIIAFAATQISRRAVGTEIWSADPAEALVWNQPNITIPAEKFADVKVGDIVHINMTDVKTGATDPWEAQVSFRSTNWKTLDKNQDIAGVGTADPITDAQYVLTGDMVKILKATGAQINGTGAKVSSVTLESVATATGTDKSIWLGSVTKDNVTINNCHFANFNNYNGVKKGDIIRVYLEKTDSEQDNWIGLAYYKGWTWTDFTDAEIETKNDYTNPVVDFIIKTDEAAAEINDVENNNGVVVVNPKQTVKQVELIREYAVKVADGITNGTVMVDKATAAEGDVVTVTATPNDGYKVLNILARGVTTDEVVVVSGGKFTMIADAVEVSATFVQPEDIIIAPESGTDISAAIKAAVTDAGKIAKSITINLVENGAYTLTSTIKAPAVTINGNGATIDASAGDNIIGIEGVDEIIMDADGVGHHSFVKAITFKDVTIKGMKKALIRDLMTKTLLETLTIDNCVMEASNAKPFIDFDSRGYVGKVVVKNSTIWAAAGTNKNFAKYGSRPKNIDETLTQEFDIQNSTIVNIGSKDDFSGGQNFNNLKQNGTAQNVYTVKNNIFVNCGKSGQAIVGLNNGQTSATPAWDVDGNAFNWNGADVSATEVSKAGKHTVGEEDVDIVQNSVAGVVTFTDAAAGNFDGEILVTSKVAKVPGDPRWKVTAKFDYVDVTIEATEITDGKITDVITSKAAGKVVKNLTVTLAANTAYTVTAPIVAAGNVSITGAEGATIDASGLDGNLITLDCSDVFAMKADGTTASDLYQIDAVTIKDVTVTGLKGALVKDNQKTYVNTLTIDNSVIEMPAAGKNVIDFSGKGYVATVTVNKSTIWAAGANTGFFAQYGSRPKNLWTKDAEDQDVLGIYDHQTFDVQNSTIVNIAKGKNVCDLKQNGTAQNVHTLKNNVFVDFGKEGQTVVGFNKGQTSDKPVWDVDGNVFNWGGKDKSAAEVEKAGKKGEEDIVKNSYAGVAVFNDAANGDFGGKFVVAPGATGPTTGIGDPRWTLTNVTGYAATIGECTGGTVKVDKDYAAEGDKIYATFTPAEGYSSSGIVAIIKNDAGEDVTSSITFGEDETGSYLIMPGFNITVSVVFQPLPKFYIIGDMNSWDRTAMTEMTYNAETEKFEFEFAPTTKVFFAFSDKQFTEAEAAADADWSIFNSTNRYALGEGDVEATLNEIKTLSKVNGTIVLNKVKEGTTYKIIVEKDFNAVTIEGEAAPEPIEDTYVVAGSSDVLFGKTWDGTAEANKMTLNAETGKYEKKYTSVSLTAGNIEYKIVKNGSVWIPDGMGNNQIVEIPADGVYDVLFTFDPATNAITGVATIATGIYSISADGTNDIFSDGKPVYNLSGQRVFKGYKGVVIKNGKKVMIK